MRELKRTLPAREIHIRLWTLRDKKSMFRASEPDSHIVELKLRNCIVREWFFTDPSLARDQYNELLSVLG